jgi:hypothetical protein
MDEIDFGGGGTVTIEGDFGSDPSLYSPGGPSINLPDFGGSVDAPAAINEKFLTQLPNLTSGDIGSFPDAPVLTGESQKLIEQQQNISKAAQDLINQQPQIKSNYQQYEQVYNQNLPLYQKNMNNYSKFMNAYNFNMQQGYGDVGNMLRSANSSLKFAEQYKKNITDAASSYTSLVQDYNNNLANIRGYLSDYQTNYDKFMSDVAQKKSTTPKAPVSPVPEKPTQPVVEPPKETKDKPTVEKPPEEKTKPKDDFSINIYPLFPGEKGNLQKKAPSVAGGKSPSSGVLSKAIGSDTLSSTLLGTSLASSPTSAEPYLLGTDEKAKNVWNTESLKNALGIG